MQYIIWQIVKNFYHIFIQNKKGSVLIYMRGEARRIANFENNNFFHKTLYEHSPLLIM